MPTRRPAPLRAYRRLHAAGACAIPLLLITAAPASLRAQATLPAVAARTDVWPREVVTTAAVVMPGKGALVLPVGTLLKVVGLEGPLINLDYGGTLLLVPVAQTDFLPRASAALASRPAPPPAGRPVAPSPALAATPAPSVLAARLESALAIPDPGGGPGLGRPSPAGSRLAGRQYVLFQFGDGRGFKLEELREAVQAARGRGASFEFVFVPAPNGTPEAVADFLRRNGAANLAVDPRAAPLIASLWSQYAHAGRFALALVDSRGQIVSQTIPMGPHGVDKFHSVLGRLGQEPPPAAAQR